jgi:phosphate transport system permease protein
MNVVILSLVFIFSLSCYFFGKSKVLKQTKISKKKFHSLPEYYGYYLAAWCGLPALIILFFWSLSELYVVKILILSDFRTDPTIDNNKLNLIFTQIKAIAENKFSGTIPQNLIPYAEKFLSINKILELSKLAAIFSAIIFSLSFAYSQILKNIKARESIEKVIKVVMFLCAAIAVFTTLGIVLSLLFESIKFFTAVSIFDFVTGTNWAPGRAFVRDASAQITDVENVFGAVPLFWGTFFIAMIAMCVAVPIGLLSGIYMAEYASAKVRRIAKPLIEVLAGIPTVVYGFFAALTVGPFFRAIGERVGLNVSSESALAAGMVMGVMIIPYVSSLTDDVINAVPRSLREGSYAMGATKSETIKKVVLPAALPGVVGSVLLAISRAVGETMIVVMAAGLGANLTINPLEASTTITAQIVTILVGDQSFNNPKTQAAFALGITLFFFTLVINIIALNIVKKFREKYE